MYIELCGTPGCGKSYLLEKLKPYILNSSYNVLELNYDKKKNKSFFYKKTEGVVRRIKIFTSTLIKEERKSIQEYIRINPLKTKSRIFYHILLDEMRKIKTASQLKYDIVLGGEGIVQSITSLSHSKVMTTEAYKMIDIIDNYFYNSIPTTLFYCYVDEDINIQRLRKRNKTGDRFLFKDDEDIKNALSIKKDNILFVLDKLKNVKVMPINIGNTDEALSFILKQLEELGYAFNAKNI